MRIFKISFFLLLLNLSFLKSAFAWPVHANVWWNPLQANAQVFNHFGAPIICSGRAQGFTQFGRSYFSYLNPTVIFPGNSYQLYVYTNYYDPFINASAFIDCNWY